ncbi:unnamed protein product [Moneuplotes crassus]|uniref:Uncharacterized protein n=1 Tax=Euplotes crassus TaxID=5936 RepID=A0AAD1XF44_EUPCR|nr:unnamed protein product [Moneuplotes crassus]
MQAFRLNNRKFSKTAVMFHDRSRFSCKYHFYKIIRRELPELKRHDKYKDLLVKEAMVWDCGSVKKLRKWPIDVMQNICDVIAQRLDDPHYVPPKPLVEEKAKSPVKLTATSPKKIVKTDSPKKETPVTLKSEIIKILSNENKMLKMKGKSLDQECESKMIRDLELWVKGREFSEKGITKWRGRFKFRNTPATAIDISEGVETSPTIADSDFVDLKQEDEDLYIFEEKEDTKIQDPNPSPFSSLKIAQICKDSCSIVHPYEWTVDEEVQLCKAMDKICGMKLNTEISQKNLEKLEKIFPGRKSSEILNHFSMVILRCICYASEKA